MLMMNSIKINCKLSLPKATSNFQHLTCKLKQPAKHNKNNVCGSEALTSRWAHMDIWEVCTAEIQGFSFLFLVDCPPVTNECSRERGFPFAQLTKSWRGAEVDQNETVFWTSLGILRLFWQYNGFTMKKKQKNKCRWFHTGNSLALVSASLQHLFKIQSRSAAAHVEPYMHKLTGWLDFRVDDRLTGMLM